MDYILYKENGYINCVMLSVIEIDLLKNCNN